VLKGAAAGLSALGLSTARPLAPPPARAALPAQASSTAATPIPDRLIGYAFNAKTQDVTLFDPTTQEVLTTKPLGAVVRWLSNEQRFWDGRSIWTYDFPQNSVQVIGVDPQAIDVVRRLPTGGTGPAHSVMLTPDRKTAWVNVAGGDYLAVLELQTGQIVDEVKTGKFP
jgi:DNA-binding beta-propeller fold protein YncE